MNQLLAVALAVLVAYLVWRHESERNAWTAERSRLVNTAIARHSGEVQALNAEPRPPKAEAPDEGYTIGASG